MGPNDLIESKELILLDDPFASLDNETINTVLNKCILGYLKPYTRILITHHLDLLPYSDYIFVMDQCCIVESGTY